METRKEKKENRAKKKKEQRTRKGRKALRLESHLKSERRRREKRITKTISQKWGKRGGVD